MRHASRCRSAGGLTLRAQPPPCTGHQGKEHRTPPPARVTQESQASVRRPSELAGSPKKERDFGLLPCAVGPCPSLLPSLRKPRFPLLVIPQWSPDEGDGSHCTAMQMNECAVSR